MRSLIVALVVSSTLAGAVLARAQADRGTIRARSNDRSVRQILTQMRTDAESFRQSIESRGRAGSIRRAADDDLYNLIDDLQTAADRLGESLDRQQVTRADLDDVFGPGVQLDNAIESLSGSATLRSTWSRVRRHLDNLATAYGVSGWRSVAYPSNYRDRAGNNRALRGTYRLDASRSDDTSRIASHVLGQVSNAERTRLERRIRNRLDAPEEISIERDNQRFTMASTRSPQVTFVADGRVQTERILGTRNRNMTTRASVYGDRLEVVATGSGENDYTATFEPIDNGNSLRVTKQLTVASVRQPIVVQSVYRRVSDVADFDLDRRASAEGDRGSDRLVPEGTVLLATLNDPLNLRTVRANDRVALTVHDAFASDGLDSATIEGYVSRAPSGSSAASELSIIFDTIRLQNGRNASFDGVVESIHGPNGEAIAFGDETVSNDGVDRETVIQRGAIGAAIGAVIGAVAGGAQGAAIGAVIGGGGGAATVLIGGRAEHELPRGTEFSIRARDVFSN